MKDIYDFVTTEENLYQTTDHMVTDNWPWRMSDHINLTVSYKNSIYKDGPEDNKPFKNIIRPILTLQYTAEDFNVKDIDIFVDNADEYFMSFLIRKYHDKWALENGIDSFIDEMVESYVDFGGVLVKNANQKRPEVVKLQSIAFCDQSDLLAGAIGIKHSYSPDQLKEVGTELGWGNEKKGATATIDQVIRKAQDTKTTPQNANNPQKTVGKNIDVYEVHGTFPVTWLKDDYEGEDYDVTYSRQLHIVTFYKDDYGNKTGICLFKGEESSDVFKLLLRDEIYNRALGMGGAEELFEPQVWTNFSEIHKKEMLQYASKVIHQTEDTGFTTRNNTKNAKMGEVWTYEQGKPLSQVNTQPVNIKLFDEATQNWEMHAKQIGFANDALMGVSPASGTPFALQDLVVQTGRGPHERRKGKIATFLEEIYREWIVPSMVTDILKGQTFLSELSLDDVESIVEDVTNNSFNQYIIAQVLDGQLVMKEEIEAMKAQFKTDFSKRGNNKFIEILKGEFQDKPISVKVNITGKQFDMAERVKKLSNVIKQVVASPQMLQDDTMRGWFNDILESSGLNPFKGKPQMPQQPQQGMPNQPQVSPMQNPAQQLSLTQ